MNDTVERRQDGEGGNGVGHPGTSWSANVGDGGCQVEEKLWELGKANVCRSEGTGRGLRASYTPCEFDRQSELLGIWSALVLEQA